MFARVIVVFALVGAGAAGAGAAAQTQSPYTPPPELRRQVEMFEANLRSALAAAGARLADRARELMPEIKLWFGNEHLVEGVLMPDDSGALFIVEPAEIIPFNLSAYEMARRVEELSNLRVINNSGSNAGVPAPKPLTVPVKPPMEYPVREYTNFVYQALIDTMLDNALSLPLREGQKLTLVVGDGTLGMPQNPLDRPRKLYLQLKGEDLLALRQNRITREVAKQRIIESRY